MSAAVTCPHCGADAPSPSPEVRVVDCAECDRSFGAPRPAAAEPPLGAAPRSQAPTDVPLAPTAAIALGATAVFFLAVVQPLGGTYIGDLFGDRGWVPYGIAWLALWAGVILLAKARSLARQRRAFALDWLPHSIAARVSPDNAGTFASHLRYVGAGVAPSFLGERLERALETFRVRRDAREVLEQIGVQAGADAAAVESSYTMVRVFIWAIPILGFIGTVMGIGSAVSGFSTSVASAVDLEVMKHSIGAVTSGLGVAFDTTLLALVMSILIMFPASSLQKAEEDLLGQVDAWCEAQLARRLEDGRTGAANGLREEIARLASSVDALERRLGSGDPDR